MRYYEVMRRKGKKGKEKEKREAEKRKKKTYQKEKFKPEKKIGRKRGYNVIGSGGGRCVTTFSRGVRERTHHTYIKRYTILIC